MGNLLEYMVHPFHTLQQIFKFNEKMPKRNEFVKQKNPFHNEYNNYLNKFFEQINTQDRVNLYAIYSEMDQDAFIQGILDTYSEVCAQPNVEAEREIAGRAVWCISGNPEIQKIINKFLDDMEIHEISTEIIRSMIQYGDHYEFLYGVRNKGITKIVACDPWEVGILINEHNQTLGYGSVNEYGDVISTNKTIPYYGMAHFRMRRRRRTDVYGVRSSLLYGVRDYWQEFQWALDKVFLERMWRRPDRLLISVDTTGMSTEDSFDFCEQVRNNLYRDHHVDMQNNPHTMPRAWAENRDIVLPSGQDNRTAITNAPASGQAGSYEDVNLFLRRLFAGLRFPPGYLGFDFGGSYVARDSLQKQDIGFSQNCMKAQRAFLSALTRTVMVHLAYLNIDPMLRQNEFSLMMTPVSTFQELERKELISLRYDFMNAAIKIGRDNNWNMNFWTRFVMRNYAHLPEDFVDKLLASEEEYRAEPDQLYASNSSGNDQFNQLLDSVKQKFSDKDRAEIKEAFVFASEGGSMFHSHNLKYNLPMDISDHTDSSVSKNEKYDKILLDRSQARTQLRQAFFKKGMI